MPIIKPNQNLAYHKKSYQIAYHKKEKGKGNENNNRKNYQKPKMLLYSENEAITNNQLNLNNSYQLEHIQNELGQEQDILINYDFNHNDDFNKDEFNFNQTMVF